MEIGYEHQRKSNSVGLMHPVPSLVLSPTSMTSDINLFVGHKTNKGGEQFSQALAPPIPPFLKEPACRQRQGGRRSEDFTSLNFKSKFQI